MQSTSYSITRQWDTSLQPRSLEFTTPSWTWALCTSNLLRCKFRFQSWRHFTTRLHCDDRWKIRKGLENLLHKSQIQESDQTRIRLWDMRLFRLIRNCVLHKDELQNILERHIPLQMLTDFRSLFDILTKTSKTLGRRLLINIATVWSAYKGHEISNIGFLRRSCNPADGLTKLNNTYHSIA